ncbi:MULTISPECIES: cation transporter [Pseudomonadaceae]|jgi:Co/Zn/Cd efflux system component|uniref:cation transporter n=1 Tax=Pseudomonadaceae TaxID=135621 RepID=UPI0007B8F116|nr:MULTISPECIES: cation transporter [Stutzerimonas]HCI3982906.1 cation transporter [Pseudomonas aeruginosa]KZX54683.1 RND transporter [Stutzerimonas frequens]MBK3874669.1 cation transporter [Stutzerimonas frequens]MBK3912938.1 cation transporter [Stutzerimonas frequens]MBK3932184.1 cation transporter [Stutzerimonas frequens]
MSEEQLEIRTASQRNILWAVLGLNIALAAAFAVTGLRADSSALIANGLDNASDSIVYIITLLALSRPPLWKRAAARVSGGLLILFAAGVLFDVVRRFLSDVEPLGSTMMVMAVIAAAVNALCVWLLKRIREADVNVRAATTFSTNDFVANAGVLIGGGLVIWTGQAWPDLVVGLAVAAIALKGGIRILRDANCEAGRS